MKKANHKTNREDIRDLQQIINVGPSIAADLQGIGIRNPQQLAGKDPLVLYQQLCTTTSTFHDPCVLDTLMACVDYMNGNPPKTWWKFTSQRKKRHLDSVESLREKFQR